MGFWTDKDHRTHADLVDDLAHGPGGGSGTKWFAGVALALLPILYGLVCLERGWTSLPGSGTRAMQLRGTEGVTLACVYLAGGLFLHFHFFWGLHPRLYRYSQGLKILCLMVLIPCLGYTLWEIFTWGNPWQ